MGPITCHSCGEDIEGEIFHGCCGEEEFNYCADCHADYRCHTDREDPREYPIAENN